MQILLMYNPVVVCEDVQFIAPFLYERIYGPTRAYYASLTFEYMQGIGFCAPTRDSDPAMLAIWVAECVMLMKPVMLPVLKNFTIEMILNL